MKPASPLVRSLLVLLKSPEMVAHAGNVTSGVSGVSSVRNDLIVKQ